MQWTSHLIERGVKKLLDQCFMLCYLGKAAAVWDALAQICRLS